MSTFWDAVGRAALGLPGTAAPRPRSMFEPGGPAALFEDLEPPLEDADTSANTPPAAAFPAAPAVQSTPAIRADEPVRQGQSAERSDDEKEQEPRASTESSDVAARLNQAGPAVASSDERVTVPLPPPFTAERPERLHLETTLVVSEIIREPDARDVPSARVSAPPPDTDRAEPSDADQQVAAHDDEPETVRPVALVAEPHAVAIEPRPLSPAPQEQPPLIVEIEHIEITIESERIAAPPPPARTARTAMPSLTDYLADRSGSHP